MRDRPVVCAATATNMAKMREVQKILQNPIPINDCVQQTVLAPDMTLNKKQFRNFKECRSAVLFITEIKIKSVQTQPSFIYYTEQHVSTYFRSSSGS
jgi:hypothetical protein